MHLRGCELRRTRRRAKDDTILGLLGLIRAVAVRPTAMTPGLMLGSQLLAGLVAAIRRIRVLILLLLRRAQVLLAGLLARAGHFALS